METLNQKVDGYHGIWYMNQPVANEYVFKYSGGLGTYCAKHSPFAVHCPLAEKTFFCYGGASSDYYRQLGVLDKNPDLSSQPHALLHMVGYFDHRSGRVPRPTLLLDKQTRDAHDNPVISVDDEGHIWIFSTSHGIQRPSYIHRSRGAFDIGDFERVEATCGDQPFENFSYFQVRHLPGRGFVAMMTSYLNWERRIGFTRSRDGVSWSAWQNLAHIEKGHYQVSEMQPGCLATAFNYHPEEGGLNYRTNLYYLESRDEGETWQTADGRAVEVPLTHKANPALVHDYEAEGLRVYLKDLQLDADGYPVILYLTSAGFEPGPKNGPRAWHTARWTGSDWRRQPVTESGSNYDMGSLFLEADGAWRLIAPTEPGPQPGNPGGEVAMWLSRDQGRSWEKGLQLTANSPYNHTYVRRPVNAHPDFYALWADGHAREPSPSRLYFCDRAGNVYRLPETMDGAFEAPEPVPAG